MPTRRLTEAHPTSAALRLLSVRELQTTLGGISRRTVYTLVESGELPIVKIRGRTMFRAADVERLIQGATKRRTGQVP